MQYQPQSKRVLSPIFAFGIRNSIKAFSFLERKAPRMTFNKKKELQYPVQSQLGRS